MRTKTTTMIVVGLVFLAAGTNLWAATITVTSASGGTGGPDCTVRDAITAANTDTATGGCPAGSGADIIELPAGVTITLTEVDNSTVGDNGLPSVTSEITINGNGATTARSGDDGTPEFRIFHAAAAGNLNLNNLTVTGGAVTQGVGPETYGGGIFNDDGTLTLTNCTVSGNSGGGGIFNRGALTLTNCTVSGNSGCGISNFYYGVVSLTNSTVSGNSSCGINNDGTLTLTNCTVSGNSGGGIRTFDTLTLINSTVSDNSAQLGGGIFIGEETTATLINSTVSGNSATHSFGNVGGGIYNQGGMLTLANSIVANSPLGGDIRADAGICQLNDLGFNIVEDGGCISCGNPSNHCTDPNLGPLVDNGGPTLTHALLSGSIAIDAIIVPGACTVTTDQRGVPRPLGPFCDIGSFETTEACSDTDTDTDGDGVPDDCDNCSLFNPDQADCQDNGVGDVCDLADGTSPDCNGNNVPDECDVSPFPEHLSENTTGIPDAIYIGPPDDTFWGIGGQIVTYDFGDLLVFDGTGPDFNVYEVDFGGVEFDIIDVLVSEDGITFVSVVASGGPSVPIAGDDLHSNDDFARSYDIASSGLSAVRLIRIDGDGTGPAGGTTGFDLDAIGIIHSSADCNGNGIPDECDIAEGNSNDCNSNDIPDECDIADGTSHDDDQNGIPDECRCPADFDGDGVVGAADLAQLLASWGPYGRCPPFGLADFNEDCEVGAADLAQLLASWGPCE